MKQFKLEIVTPDGSVFDGMAESLIVHTTEGDSEFLAGHSDYVAAVGTGRARIIADGKSRTASVSGGFVTVKDGEVRLVPVTFEFADKIDRRRASLAKERAEAEIASAKDKAAIDLAKAKLARALNRLHVSELIK